MAKWIQFTVDRRWSGGNPKVVASLARNELYIGRLLREAGFETQAKYELYFDEEGRRIGLRPSPKGFECYQSDKNGPRMRLTRFCERFNLKGNYAFDEFVIENGMWVLPLPPPVCECICPIHRAKNKEATNGNYILDSLN